MLARRRARRLPHHDAAPSSETVWYYADGADGGSGPMSSDIQMLCAEGGATFVAP